MSIELELKPIPPDERRVANIHEADYVEFESEDNPGASVLQLNRSRPNGVGFHIFKMPAGARSDAHEHSGDEEFLVLEGELVDHDGYVYRAGDLVWLKKGTQHWSYTEAGCLLAVHIEAAESLLKADD